MGLYNTTSILFSGWGQFLRIYNSQKLSESKKRNCTLFGDTVDFVALSEMSDPESGGFLKLLNYSFKHFSTFY